MAATRDDTDPARDSDPAGDDAQPTVLLDLDELRSRPTVVLPRQRRPGRKRAPLLLAAAVAVGWATLVSALPPLLAGWFAGTGFGTGLRLGLAGWLLGHGVPVRTAVGPLTLAPLALGALAAWRLERAGLHAVRAIGARRTGAIGRTLAVAGALGLVYGLVGGLAALVVGGDGEVAVTAWRAVLTLTVFGAVAGGVGAARASGAAARLHRALPVPVRLAARFGTVAALTLLALGAAAAGLALALAWDDASKVLGAYRTGVGGQLGLTLLCAAYLPNVAVWAAAYLLGPGFALGTETSVTVAEVHVGALPAVPLFAGLPDGDLAGLGLFVAAAPVLAGGFGGWLLARAAPRGGDGPDWSRLLGAAALSGPVAGALLGAAAWAGGGALGAGRLAELGPVAWQVALVAAGGGLVGAVLVAAAHGLLRGRRR
ncbi:hypothetical protein GCM10010123_31710 [Pilimelia anulata]|uniref:Uncharacterized protein n=1 Tax=Pilimelia anulata TaxID=53371 RepID=A0A8J3FAY2_9ACTN|nr:DUF6350 family protein [Pilimelia anulata]GGJ99495.1 hypothetical protein GCM10010123_31710 [Pilimelia anulata]